LARAQFMQLLEAGLATYGQPGDGGVVLSGPLEGESYRIRTPQFTRVDDAPALRVTGTGGSPIVVELLRQGAVMRRIEASSGMLRMVEDPHAADPSLLVELNRVRVYDAGVAGSSTEHPELSLPRMVWPGRVFEVPQAAGEGGLPTPSQLRKYAELPIYASEPGVRGAYNGLRDSLQSLTRRIVSQLHERATSAVSCLVLCVIGALMSIRMKDALPLVVYFWTFAMAIITLVMSGGGENIATSNDHALVLGLGVMWAGNAGLLLVAFFLYRQVSRN